MLELLTAAAILFLADQGSKRVIHARGEQLTFGWGSFVRIRCVLHRAGLYQSRRAHAMFAGTWLLALISAATLYWMGLRFQTGPALVGLGLAFGGSGSNLFDILRDRYIVDFIDLGWWPVFNLADVAIVAGLAMALFL
jgi:signal peptidase II